MAKRSQYNGLVSTEFQTGELCSLELVVAKTAERRATLRGYGNNERNAAQHLVEQMRFFADWIARRYGLPSSATRPLCAIESFS